MRAPPDECVRGYVFRDIRDAKSNSYQRWRMLPESVKIAG